MKFARICTVHICRFFSSNLSFSFHFPAPAGFLIKLDFRNKFNIEPSQGCEFDYLEVSTYDVRNLMHFTKSINEKSIYALLHSPSLLIL